jgi:hypothetical protein
MSITMHSRRYGRKALFLDDLQRTLTAVVSNVASLAILAVLLVAVWVAFSFVRVSLAEDEELAPATLPTPASTINTGGANLSRREPLVYVADDSSYFHVCGHNPTGATRHALPASMARTRGYEPCPDCIKVKNDN